MARRSKKKPRSIHVDGEDYLWKVGTIDPQYALLTIYHGNKKYMNRPLLVRFKFDNPMWNYEAYLTVATSTPDVKEILAKHFNFDGMTPGEVAKIIRRALFIGWSPSSGSEPYHREWDSDTEDLFEIEDASVPGDDPFGLKQ